MSPFNCFLALVIVLLVHFVAVDNADYRYGRIPGPNYGHNLRWNRTLHPKFTRRIGHIWDRNYFNTNKTWPARAMPPPDDMEEEFPENPEAEDIIPDDPDDAVDYLDRIWPGGIVPVDFGSAHLKDWVPIGFIMEDIERQTIKHGVPCIKFRNRNEDDKYYIRFEDTGRCCSRIGRRKNGITIIELSNRCVFGGRLIHLFIHALGFHKTYVRPDRDKFFRINWDNIKPELKKDFKVAEDAYVTTPEPDYWSVMMYGAYEFAIDPSKPTVERLDGGRIPTEEERRKVRGYLSEGDVQAIRTVYKCGPEPDDDIVHAL